MALNFRLDRWHDIQKSHSLTLLTCSIKETSLTRENSTQFSQPQHFSAYSDNKHLTKVMAWLFHLAAEL